MVEGHLDLAGSARIIEIEQLAQITKIDDQFNILGKSQTALAFTIKTRHGTPQSLFSDGIVARTMQSLQELLGIERARAVLVKVLEGLTHGFQILVHGNELVKADLSTAVRIKGEDKLLNGGDIKVMSTHAQSAVKLLDTNLTGPVSVYTLEPTSDLLKFLRVDSVFVLRVLHERR